MFDNDLLSDFSNYIDIGNIVELITNEDFEIRCLSAEIISSCAAHSCECAR